MTEEQIKLARRAVACKGWRWMPGMRAVGRRNLPAAWFRLEESTPSLTGEWSGALPDLTDPATLGCVLALVREAWEEPLLGVAFDFAGEDWLVRPWNRSLLWQGAGATEAEALVAALESAP